MTLSAAVLETPDPRALAAFYRTLLGWPVVEDGPTWVMLRPEVGAGLSFQQAPDYVRPTWPTAGGAQQMMAHLEIAVDDLLLLNLLAGRGRHQLSAWSRAVA